MSEEAPGPDRETRLEYDLPSEMRQRERQSQRLLLLVLRMLFMVMLVTVTLLPFVGDITREGSGELELGLYLPVLIGTFAFGALVLYIDARMPHKRLAPVFGVYLGVVAGLVGALAIGALIDLIAQSWSLDTQTWQAYLGVIKVALGITLCYLAISIVLTTKDDFRLVIPYVEFAKQVRGVRPLLLDTSALIDGRIESLGQTGFIDAPLIVPQFVIEELQTLADSADRLKRARGRRGLGTVSNLQANPYVDVSIDNAEGGGGSVDHQLLQLAREQTLRILTTDYNLNKVAQIHGVPVLNINDLASGLKAEALPGEELAVEIVKPGEAEGQGVGYMPDGTMVVVEDAAPHIGSSVVLVVSNSLQTSAGRMIFGKMKDSEGLGKSAVHQPRQVERPDRKPKETSGRNPRR